jgi:DNA-binding MarR family transcriptional regulator
VPDTSEDLLEAVSSVSRLTRTLRRSGLYERASVEAGIALDRTALQILGIIRKAEEPMNVKEIAEAMQVEGPHATRQVHKLVMRGLATKTIDPDDRRVARIELTPEGIELVDRYHAVIKRWMREAVAHWPHDERQLVCRLINRWVDDIEAYFDKLDAQPIPRSTAAAQQPE